ncbi:MULTISPECIES: glycosyltransferase family 1 protein [Parabacteroides]|uniref:glycosyltransferase family 4 protein n=1 Tax=Parabacteroides leei TaxID=2939491 RepID=UPI001897DDDA|nr:glycosyltransferase family 1 protein [Parabacteroides goldsteinii]
MLYIDGIIFSLQKAGGISLVFAELLNRITEWKSHKCVLLEYKQGLTSNICRKTLFFPNRLDLDSRLLFLKRYLDVHIHSSERFIFHSSYYRICKNKHAINITTVHDFIYEYYVTGLPRYIHSWQKNRAIRKSKYIICISESTKRDLLKFLPDVDPKKIKVIYNGVSDDYYPLPVSPREKIYFPPRSYVLFVGSRAGYKNFNLAMEAVACTTLNVLIVGTPLSSKEKHYLDKLFSEKRYHVISGIDNSLLNIYYNGAYCLLYPSAYEGFGLPVVEAQRAGCPVIAYNSSSISEIIGDTPLLLNDLSVNSITQALDTIKEPLLRSKVVEKGLCNAQRFSWDRMYEEVLQLYKEALDI